MEQMEVSEAKQPLMDVMVYNSPEEFNNKIQEIPYISGGLTDLANSPAAVVYFHAPCCALKCPCAFLCKCNCTDCGENFFYNTLVLNNGDIKYLYRNQGRLDCKICGCDPFARFAYVKSLNLSAYNQINEGVGTESVEMTKEDTCLFCGICSAFLPVTTKPDNTRVGYVKYKGFCEDFCKNLCLPCIRCFELCKNCPCNPCNLCCDYFYVCDVCNPDKNVVYTIFLKRCCLSCLPFDCLEKLTFVIRNASGNEVGQIDLRRACCVCNGLRQRNCTYTITFPPDASPELKLTIINAVYSIDMFIF